MGFLDLFRGQQPLQAQEPQQQGGFFGGRLGVLNDPYVALPLAAHLMQPGGFGENLGAGFADAGRGLETRRKLQQDQFAQSATAKWLESQGADAGLVELAKSGQGALAMQQWNAMKPEKVDPLDTLRAKKLDLEINQLSQPQETDYQRRVREAEQAGLKTDSPAYQSYVLTGKMPREDQGPLTAVDKKAILEADEQVQANEAVINSLKSVVSGEEGKTLNDRAGYGSGATTQAWIARNDPTGLFDDAKGEATTEFNNVVLGQALSSMKSIFGGNPTEGERAVLIDLQASVDKTPQERKKIIDRGIVLAERRLQFNKERANELRGGTFYKQEGGIPAPAPQQGTTSTNVPFRVVQ